MSDPASSSSSLNTSSALALSPGTSPAVSSAKLEEVVRQEEAYLRLVHPTPADIPSCMSLLDDFLSCNIVGPQVKSLYRYGHASVCGPKMDEFKFCMSIKSLHPEEKRDVWIRRRAEWWARRRLGRSSEDVWETRTEPLKANLLPVPPLNGSVTTIG